MPCRCVDRECKPLAVCYSKFTAWRFIVAEYNPSLATDSTRDCQAMLRRVQQLTLGMLVLVSVAHANLTTDLTGKSPNSSGITRLGRDLLRRSVYDSGGYPLEWMWSCERALE
jgi:hypothetical protein